MVKEYKATLDSFMKKYNISEVDMKAIENKIIHSGGKHTMNTEWNYGNAVFFAGTTILTVGRFFYGSSLLSKSLISQSQISQRQNTNSVLCADFSSLICIIFCLVRTF